MTTASTNLDKYQLFHDLSTEVAKLIADLESQLKQRMSKSASAQPQKTRPLSYRVGQGLRSFWSGATGKSESSLPSLRDYIEYNESINDIINITLQEININLFEQYDTISDIVDKFKNDFRSIIKKYSNILEPEYHASKVQAVKTHGSPYEASPKDEEEQSKMEKNYKNIIRRHIHRIQKPDYESKISADYFEKGERKPDYFVEVLAWLIDSNIDISNESKVNEALKKYGFTANNFLSILNYVYPRKEDVKTLYSNVRNRKINIPNSIQGIKKEFSALRKEEMENVLNQLEQIKESGNEIDELHDAIDKLSQEENLDPVDKVFYNIIKNYLVFDEENELKPMIKDLYDIYINK